MGCAVSQPIVKRTILLKTISDKPFEGVQFNYSFKVDVVPVKLTSRTEGHVRHVADLESMTKLHKGLGEKYKDHQRLLILHHIPPPIERSAQRAKTEQIQAIFYESKTSVEEDDKTYTLSVEHVNVLGKIVGDVGFRDCDFEVKSNINHIIDLIQDKAATGARFVTAAMTGSSMYQGFNFSLDGSKPVLQMDFVFEIPSIHNVDLYVYHVEPIQVIQKMRESSFGKKVVLECDWISHFEQQLKKGWRLVDIFTDGSSKTRQSKSGTEVIKTYLWILEKPFTEEIETIPRYEGAIIEQSVRRTSEKALSVLDDKAYWESEITNMGLEGWELACIIQNISVIRTMCQVKFGSVIFFQRKLNY